MLKGFSVAQILTAPPPIGNTTPNSGAFTTLSASGAFTLGGGTANGVLYLNGSKVATSGTGLEFDGTNFGIGTGGNPMNHQSVLYRGGANAVYLQVGNGLTGLGATQGMRFGLNALGVGELYSVTSLTAYIDNTARLQLTTAGNFIAGNQSALATTATDGFIYVPTCAGTPTGTPTAFTGMAPIVVNTTNNKLYFYSGGQWRDAGP